MILVITLVDYNRRLNPVSLAMREQFGVMNAGLAEAIAGIEVVKANVQERYEWDKFTQQRAPLSRSFRAPGRNPGALSADAGLHHRLGGGLLPRAPLWRAGAITLGQVVAFMGLMGTLRFPTFISLFTFNLVQLGIASARRILELINTETELDENPRGVARRIRGEVVFDG